MHFRTRAGARRRGLPKDDAIIISLHDEIEKHIELKWMIQKKQMTASEQHCRIRTKLPLFVDGYGTCTDINDFLSAFKDIHGGLDFWPTEDTILAISCLQHSRGHSSLAEFCEFVHGQIDASSWETLPNHTLTVDIKLDLKD